MSKLNPKTEQAEQAEIRPYETVTVTEMGHLVEVQHMQKKNTKARIQKIDADHYVNLRTGELMEFQKSETRADNENSLRQTFKKLRYMVNNNFNGSKNELFLTLTYAENMTDTKRLYDDMKKFMMRVRYHYRNTSTIDYLNIIEPQGRGAWHAHILMRFNDVESIYIPNKFVDNKPVDAPMYKLWGHGWVTIKSLSEVDNIGAYLSAYLTDLELDDKSFLRAVSENREVVIREVDGKQKKFIKGGRLHMYPPGMNMFRPSRGIKKPKRTEIQYKDIKKIVGSAEPHYSKTYDIDTEKFQNKITFEQYNLKR